MRKIAGGVTKRLEEMVKNLQNNKAFFERIVYPSYIRAQLKRWMTVGRSDSAGNFPEWKSLNERYRLAKRTRFAGYPGGGRKTLIATNKLLDAVTGRGPGHYKAVSDSKIVIGVDVAYAKYVNASRPFMIFSDKFLQGLRSKYGQFMLNRKTGGK